MAGSNPENTNIRTPGPRTTEVSDTPSPADHRVQVAAARLRVTLDIRLGRTTPAKTVALAREAL